MNFLFKAILSLSVAGSFLILCLFFFRPLFQRRMSKKWQYYIWLLIIARLLFPFFPQISSVGTIFSTIKEMTSSSHTDVTASSEQEIESDLTLENDMKIKEESIWIAEGRKDGSGIFTAWKIKKFLSVILGNFGYIWLTVALILFIRKITIYQNFVQYVKAGQTEVDNIELLEQLSQIKKQLKLSRCVELYENNLISTPLLLGFLHPYIVLPTSEVSSSDFRYIVLHELTHYKRRDIFYKWLVQVVVCLYWFNPLIYVMGHEINRLCELACDEAVIENMDLNERRKYGNMLMNVIGACGYYQNSQMAVSLSESGKILKERLKLIMEYNKKEKFAIGTIILVTLFLGIVTVVVGTYFNMTETVATVNMAEIEEYEKDTDDTNYSTSDIRGKQQTNGAIPMVQRQTYFTEQGVTVDSFLYDEFTGFDENMIVYSSGMDLRQTQTISQNDFYEDITFTEEVGNLEEVDSEILYFDSWDEAMEMIPFPVIYPNVEQGTAVTVVYQNEGGHGHVESIYTLADKEITLLYTSFASKRNWSFAETYNGTIYKQWAYTNALGYVFSLSDIKYEDYDAVETIICFPEYVIQITFKGYSEKEIYCILDELDLSIYQ